jgi:hypothetical protein
MTFSCGFDWRRSAESGLRAADGAAKPIRGGVLNWLYVFVLFWVIANYERI